MLVARYNPFQEFERRFFNHYPSAEREGEIATFNPKVNTRETDEAYFVDVDLPGVNKEDIKISIKEGVLSIEGERSIKEEVKEEDYYKVESTFGSFSRTFSLSDKIDTEHIEAKNENGVLEVRLPKRPEVDTTKTIAIN